MRMCIIACTKCRLQEAGGYDPCQSGKGRRVGNPVFKSSEGF